MKYCSHCGKELLDDAVICPNCGCAVDNQTLKKRNSLNTMCLVGFILSFFTGLIVSIIGYNEVKRTDDSRSKKFAIAGIVLASIGIVISIISTMIQFRGIWNEVSGYSVVSMIARV